MLEVTDLHVGFVLPNGAEVHAVRGLSLVIEPGESFGLVGESGCGKSTVALAMMGLLPSNAWVSGRISVRGRDILSQSERQLRGVRWKDSAMVPQGAMNALNPVRTVGRQLTEPMLLHGTVPSKKDAVARARELLEMVGIPGARLDRYPHELSGGMRQRVTIAMALACGPAVLLADEPTTALDVMVQAQILKLLRTLCDELQLALMLVTHDLAAVAQICQKGGVMYAGELVETGSMDKLYHQPRHPYTGRLFAATPDLHGLSAVTSIPGAPPRLDQPMRGCPFAPRCDRALATCEEIHPARVTLPDGTLVTCSRYQLPIEVSS